MISGGRTGCEDYQNQKNLRKPPGLLELIGPIFTQLEEDSMRTFLAVIVIVLTVAPGGGALYACGD